MTTAPQVIGTLPYARQCWKCISYILIALSVRLWRVWVDGVWVAGRGTQTMIRVLTKKRVVRVEKVDPVNYPVSGRAGGAGLDRCLWQGLGSGSGWMGGGPGPWFVNTADEETGSPRRKGGPSQLSSVRKGRWSRGNEGWNRRVADGTALDTGVRLSVTGDFTVFEGHGYH
jgi:hypothetical protein